MNATSATALLAKVDPTAVSGGSALASWTPLVVLLTGFGVIAAALLMFGRPADTGGAFARHALRIPNALERFTGAPGWAMAAVGTSLFGLLTAGVGFYSDVAWHVALGRDEVLFTAPHTAIVVGLGLIANGAALGILFATLQRADVGRRWFGLQVPWSMIPLGLLGVSALLGFPLDELWHAEFGIDVTMWSPTHMLMILGASFTGIACWHAFAEAGVRPEVSVPSRVLHVFAAWLTLQGLAASQGEFAFGVPQFQQLFHPVLIAIAAGFALVSTRLVLGPFYAVGIAAASLFLQLPGGEQGGPVETREAGFYVVSAIAIELVAVVFGTANRLRFAVASGLAVGTVGFAGEYVYNQRAYQPWNESLLPEAIIFSVVAAVGAAVLATGFTRAFRLPGRHVPAPLLALAGIAVLGTILLPMPRRVGDVHAELTLVDEGDGRATVRAELSPPDAADDTRWFQAISWQGGGLVLADMEEVEPGVFVSEQPVPVDGPWKTMVRLHRDDQMMTVPVYLPADPEIDEPEIPAVDRSQPFEAEQEYLLREAEPGAQWLAWTIHALLAAAVAVWMAAFTFAVRRIESEGRDAYTRKAPGHRRSAPVS